MAFKCSDLTNPFVKLHLAYVEHTEPPQLFHVWSALTTIAAALQRNVYIDRGIGQLYGNMFVLLVGPPGTRKSTAIDLAVRLMRDATDVRFAPDDTGGQRQGLIRALLDDEDADVDVDTANANALDAVLDLELNLDTTNKHVLFVHASEFGTFIGRNNLDLTRFLIRMWDGEDYVYRLRDARDVLRGNLMTMLGGTTPTDIATLLPPEAMGQGFMSRIVLVFAPNKQKEVPPSKIKLLDSAKTQLLNIYATVNKMRGVMTVDRAAEALLDDLYVYGPKMQDTRFIYYIERRQTHMQKLAMALAASRGSMVITFEDVQEAHTLLMATEAYMPDALGEFGMSPVAVAQQKMLEFMRFAKEPVSERVLYAVMQRDMRLVDFKNSLSALINTNKISAFDTADGRFFMYNDAAAKQLAAMGEDVLAMLLEDSAAGPLPSTETLQ